MTASRLYTEQIEASIKDLKIIMRGKFAAKESIFDFVWKSLEKENNSLEGLDSYYTLEIKGLKEKIEKHARDKKIDLKKINFTDNDLLTLEKMVGLRHILARQYFVTAQLNKFVWDVINQDLTSLLRDSLDIIESFGTLDLPGKKIHLDELDQITKKIAHTLQQRRLLDDEENYKTLNSLEHSKTEEIRTINECLPRIPSMDEINLDPRDASDEITTIYTTINTALTDLFQLHEKMTIAIQRTNARVNNKIQDIEIKKQINEFYFWLLKFGVKNKKDEKGCAGIPELTQAVSELVAACNDSNIVGKAFSALAGTGDKLHERFVSSKNTLSLVNKLKEFIKSQEKFVADVEQLQDQKNVLTEKQAQGISALKEVNSQLSRSKQLWKRCSDVFTEVYNTILKGENTKKSTSFLKRHWWKILLGGIVGGAVAAAATFFLLPIVAITITSMLLLSASIVLGIVIGSLVTAGIAKLIDTCFSRKKSKAAVLIPIKPQFDSTFDLSAEETSPDLAQSETISSQQESRPPASDPKPIPTAPVPKSPPATSSSWFSWFGSKPSPANPAPTPKNVEEGARNTYV